MSHHFVLIVLAVLALLPFSDACRRRDQQMHSIGPEVNASFVIYFNQEVSQQDINSFSTEVFEKARRDGRGHDLPDGVYSFSRVDPVEGHEAIAISFLANVTPEQRESLMDKVKASPLVFKVLENVAPARIKKIE